MPSSIRSLFEQVSHFLWRKNRRRLPPVRVRHTPHSLLDRLGGTLHLHISLTCAVKPTTNNFVLSWHGISCSRMTKSIAQPPSASPPLPRPSKQRWRQLPDVEFWRPVLADAQETTSLCGAFACLLVLAKRRLALPLKPYCRCRISRPWQGQEVFRLP